MSTDNQNTRAAKDPDKNLLGGFEILAKIGQGAMGTVFKARQVSVNRIVALKVLPLRLAKNEKYVQCFLKEVQSAAKLNHPNIVQVYDAGTAGGYYYLAMEYVDGQTVRKVLEVTECLPERRALEIARDIARALECAHSAGLVHRDVKPDNILIAPDRSAKLADLGIARETSDKDGSVAQVSDLLGTPDYIAPEQIRGETNLDGRCDIYSLGATLYHMLTGSPPYKGGAAGEVMAMHLKDPVPNPRKISPRVSIDAGRIVHKAMAKEPQQRYATAGDLADDIERVLAAAPVAAGASIPRPKRDVPAPVESQPGPAEPHAAATRPRASSRPRRRRIPFLGTVAAMATLAAIVGVGVWAVNRTTGESEAQTIARKNNELLESVRKWVSENPGQYSEAQKRYAAIRKTITAPDCARKIDEDLVALEKQRNEAAGKALANIQREAEKLRQAGKYDDAIAKCSAVPAEFQDILQQEAGKKAEEIRAEAESRIKTACSEAVQLVKKGQPAEALQILERAQGIQYAARSSEVEQARRAATDELDRMQEKAIEELLDSIDAAVAKGNYADAARLAEAVVSDQKLGPPKAKARTIVAVARLLPGVERMSPDAELTPDGFMACAMVALGKGDRAKMEAALRNAGGHALYARYEAKLADLPVLVVIDPAEEALSAFRKQMAVRLPRRDYGPLAAELDRMIADPQLLTIKEALTTDRRLVAKMTSFLEKVRADVRVGVGRPARYRGIPTQIKKVEGDLVTFALGNEEIITEMRAIDLKRLFEDLNPGAKPEWNECLAFILIADGRAKEAQPHVEKVADKTDIEHLQRIMGKAPEEPAAPPPPPPPVEPAGTPALPAADRQALLEKNEEFYKKAGDLTGETAEMKRKPLKNRWAEICAKVTRMDAAVETARRYEREDPYYTRYRIARQDAEKDLEAAVRERETVAPQIKMETAKILRAEIDKKNQLLVIRDRHQRLIKQGVAMTEQQIEAAFDQEMRKD